jgi:hypothetical protein
VSVTLEFLNQRFAASSGEETSPVSMKPMTNLLSPGFFRVALQLFPLSIHSRTYSGQFSSFIPSALQSLRNFTASRSANLTSRRVVHERDTCSKFFCRVSLIERNAISRDLDFPHQAALLLANPTSAFGMIRVQLYCHEESGFTTRRFRIATH